MKTGAFEVVIPGPDGSGHLSMIESYREAHGAWRWRREYYYASRQNRGDDFYFEFLPAKIEETISILNNSRQLQLPAGGCRPVEYSKFHSIPFQFQIFLVELEWNIPCRTVGCYSTKSTYFIYKYDVFLDKVRRI
jgi:hypothetical protein